MTKNIVAAQQPNNLNLVIPSHLTWKCKECKSILGYTDSAKTTLRLKYKDQYSEVYKAQRVSTTCRRCGLWNTVESIDADPT